MEGYAPLQDGPPLDLLVCVRSSHGGVTRDARWCVGSVVVFDELFGALSSVAV